jgi:biopolymer transport protein ExbB/TolQ
MFTVSQLAAALALIGGVASVVSAIASSRSASAAREGIRNAKRLERARLEQELARACAKVISLSIGVDDFANQLKPLALALYGHQQAYTSSIAAVERKQRSAGELQQAAREQLERRPQWASAPDDELRLSTSTMELHQIALERVHTMLDRQVSSLDSELRFREEIGSRGSGM